MNRGDKFNLLYRKVACRGSEKLCRPGQVGSHSGPYSRQTEFNGCGHVPWVILGRGLGYIGLWLGPQDLLFDLRAKGLTDGGFGPEFEAGWY